MLVCIRSSLHSVHFGQLLRRAHERIVNIMKLYIKRINIQVELIGLRFRKKRSPYSRLLLRSEVFNATDDVPMEQSV